MTPKEKAKELVRKFDELLPCEGTTTAQAPMDYALITVDELINDINVSSPFEVERLVFWNEVKQEIEKL